MTKVMVALKAGKAELACMVLDLDDMELVKKAKAAPKRTTTSKEGPFFTNLANLEHFRRPMKQKESGKVTELTPELQKELLGL